MAKASVIARSKKKPKFSSRIVRRCFRCGRKHGFMRDFGLCRICFREMATNQEIPGNKESELVTTIMYYQLLPQMKNAIRARKDAMTVPFSKMDLAVLQSLVTAGYVKSVEKEAIGKKNMLVVKFVKKGAMTDFKLISKPSRHFYADYRSLKRVMQGHGAGVLSTSRGVMTDREARKQKVGGEYLFEIW